MSYKISTTGCESCQGRCKSPFSNLRTQGFSGFEDIKVSLFFEEGLPIPSKIDDRESLYCIKSGYVKLCHSSGAALRICGPGDIIGYNDIADNQLYVAIALSSVHVCSFDKKALLDFQDQHPAIAKEFIRMLSREIQLRDERIHYLENFSVKNKVAATLFSLNKKFGTPSDQGSKISVLLERKTLAQLSGTVVESLARNLTDLENSKVILRVGRYIHVLDPEKLQQISME